MMTYIYCLWLGYDQPDGNGGTRVVIFALMNKSILGGLRGICHGPALHFIELREEWNDLALKLFHQVDHLSWVLLLHDLPQRIDLRRCQIGKFIGKQGGKGREHTYPPGPEMRCRYYR